MEGLAAPLIRAAGAEMESTPQTNGGWRVVNAMSISAVRLAGSNAMGALAVVHRYT